MERKLLAAPLLWSERPSPPRPTDRISGRRGALPGGLPRMGQFRIQASGGRGLGQGAGGQGRAVLQLALPLAGRRRLVAAQAAKRLPGRSSESAGSSSCTNASGEERAASPPWKKATSSTWSGPWAWDSRSTRPGRTSSCSAVASALQPWRRFPSSPANKAVGVTAILSARSAEFVMTSELFEKVGRAIQVLDSDGTSAVENVEQILRTAGRGRQARTPSSPAAPIASCS